MKNKFTLLCLALVTVTAATAAPLAATTAVHTKPDESAPSITFLKAGSEPTVAQEALPSTPAGWLAVELQGPFEAYVMGKDLLKSLDVKNGAAIHLAPTPESAVLTTFEPGDKAEITGLHGRWTQISLSKKIVGYIHLGNTPAAPAPLAASTAAAGTPAPFAPAPVSPTAYGVAVGGNAAPAVALNGAGSSSLPRLFQGKFVSTRSRFHPRRPYDWAVNDSSGSRYAYLDMSKLLLTEQIESYVGHEVVVYGAARPLPGGKDMVIEVESLQLK